jgi:hypothetical protein
MKIKTQDLIDDALDWAVIVALYGKHDWLNSEHVAHFKAIRNLHVLHQQGHYSTDWSQGGPIIEKERICVSAHADGANWQAWISFYRPMYEAPTPLIAAMRCYAASKLGDEIDIPEELK